MKAIHCTRCHDIRALSVGHVVVCECGCAAGAWRDPIRGKAIFYEAAEGCVEVIGVHNHFLTEPGINERYKVWENADGYLFKTYQSPVIRIRPGMSNDTILGTFDEVERAAEANPNIR